MLVIGLTGNLGVGKTTVAGMFQELGAKVLDADRIAHGLIRPGTRSFKRVVRHFGEGILKKGRINRGALAAVVFHDRRTLQALNRLIHPEVIREIQHRISLWRREKDIPLVVVEAALLIESGLHTYMDRVVVVKAGRVLQLKRARERKNLTPKDILKRVKMQLSLKKQLQHADFIIDNRGSFRDTRKQVEDLWHELQQTSHGK